MVNPSDHGLRLEPGLFIGEVSGGLMTLAGIEISGKASAQPGAEKASEAVIVASGTVACRVSIDTAGCFVAPVMISAFRPPLFVELSVYVVGEDGRGSELPLVGAAARLLNVRIGNRSDFLKLIQSPSDRLKDANLLFYTAYFGLGILGDDFSSKSAALCTMGYRLLEGFDAPEQARETYWRETRTILAGHSDAPRGLWLRWHTSVRLAAGYNAYRDGDFEDAAAYFDGIGDFAFELSHWPSALTNVLIGIFLTGWTRYQSGAFDEAIKAWQRAEGVLRYGAAIVQLPNMYAFGELGNAVRVAQECYVGLKQAENGGKPVADEKFLPKGYELDIHHLPGLRHNLGIR